MLRESVRKSLNHLGTVRVGNKTAFAMANHEFVGNALNPWMGCRINPSLRSPIMTSPQWNVS